MAAWKLPEKRLLELMINVNRIQKRIEEKVDQQR